MSIELMNAAFAAVMPPAEKLVMLKICDHANDDGVAWPSVGKLAQAACISERQAQRVMKRLAAEGYLEIVGNEKGGAGNARVYRVKRERFLSPLERKKGDKMTPPKGDKMSGQNVTLADSERVTSEAEKGDILTQKGDIAMSQKGDTAMSPESSRTPILENHQGTTNFPPADLAAGIEGELVDDETALQAACRETWAAFCEAYEERYTVRPLRHAQVNANVKTFVQRVGYEDAPKVAAFYVWINDQFLVRNSHEFQYLTRNAGSYWTQWKRQKPVTATTARQQERTQANRSAAEEAKEIVRRRQQGAEAYKSPVAEEAKEIHRQRQGASL